ncbi:PAS domain S-box protein [Mucilaginibacter limnophilus]|uniref:histidine kinase n=1 Tax=Mucilaginibacter limnophilus TaxID=1932778 RepID=A0A437MR72_9SPHI|nr:PAS domain S-box protein [Mucilaginibacter limnophilus]RVU00149.1 PAS domain S-box protein [Mucilaginibacter limnophilus]
MSTDTILTKSIDEKLFRLLVASVKDCSIFLIDPNGYILSWNQGAEHIKGYRAEEVIGKNISIFYLKNDSEKLHLRNNLNQALRKGTYECEGWRVRKDGSMFWAHVVFTTIYNDAGHLIGFAKVTRDITEQKRNEERKAEINAELERRVRENTEKIIANELRFRKLIENSYEGITLLNENLQVCYRSSSSERINGWEQTENLDSHAEELIHPEDMPFMRTLFDQVKNNPVEPFIITFRMLHKQGHYIWVEGVFTNMLHDENIHAIVCNFRDITEKKQAQIERDKITVDLVQRNKDLEQFTYIVSHNLRAPVANISGLTSLLRDTDAADPDQPATLEALALSVKNLDNVILDLNHVLQVSSEANDKIEEVSLPKLVEEIKLGIQSMIQKNEASIVYDFGAFEQLFTLKGYLHSIFQNLIVNSIKYRMPDIPPVITINSELKDGMVYIHFNDNGRGIDLCRYAHHLFGLYKRFDQSVEGKGMGLFMVKMQTERLGGNINAKSKINEGTTFTLQFPDTLLHAPK